MKFLIIFILSFSLFAESEIETAERLKLDPKTQEQAQELFFKLSLEGNSFADIELGKLYIYGEGIPQDCKRGIIYFLNATTAKIPNYDGFKEISYLFKEGVCVKKDEQKAEKYKRIYDEKTK